MIRLLVVDDVWDIPLIKELKEALPPNFSLIITTRKGQLLEDTTWKFFLLLKKYCFIKRKIFQNFCYKA